MKQYSHTQIMLSFAYISYYGFALRDAEPQRAERIAEEIRRALKTWLAVKDQQWELVWGPGLAALKDDVYDDNMTFVARKGDEPNTYVIATRGTNPISLRDWVIEDFDVGTQVDWAYGSPPPGSKPRISQAASIGLNHLLDMRPASTVPGAGTTLAEFLTERCADGAGKEMKVCVTGHSLGGARAPTLARYLVDELAPKLAGQLDVSYVAFAGPTAGNADYAAYSAARLPAGPHPRVAHSLDIVPHVWTTRSILGLFGIYARHWLVPGPLIALAIAGVSLYSLGKGYTQVQAAAPPVPGKYRRVLYNYLLQAIDQHAYGYPRMLDMSSPEEIPVTELFVDQIVDPELTHES